MIYNSRLHYIDDIAVMIIMTMISLMTMTLTLMMMVMIIVNGVFLVCLRTGIMDAEERFAHTDGRGANLHQ